MNEFRDTLICGSFLLMLLAFLLWAICPTPCAKRKPEKKPMKKRDKYLIAAIINLSWYCVAVLVLTALGHAAPDSLTVAWFSCWTVELALLAGIKIKSREE